MEIWFLATFLRIPRGKIVGIANVPREISNKVGHSKVSLDLPSNLGIQKFKNVKFEIFNFFHVFGYSFANISRSIRPRSKVLGSYCFT